MIPHGTGKRLYLYWDLLKALAWAKDPAEFRKLTGVTHGAIRTSHLTMALPPGYARTSGTLANDPIVRMP
jgi:hypothetical protein